VRNGRGGGPNDTPVRTPGAHQQKQVGERGGPKPNVRAPQQPTADSVHFTSSRFPEPLFSRPLSFPAGLHHLSLPEPASQVGPAPSRNFHSPELRLSYSSMVTPPSTLAYDFASKKMRTVKQLQVGPREEGRGERGRCQWAWGRGAPWRGYE
jgi:hypothetical protein